MFPLSVPFYFSQSSLLLPAFDETPNIHHDSLTPSVDGTENVIKLWEVSQQLRVAVLQNMAAPDEVESL